MIARSKLLLGVALAWMGAATANADIILGSFDFNSSQFGDTLIEPDGGVFSAANWLNTFNADPGNPAYLTGANFDTGIANIGTSLAGRPLPYTIGYLTPITNGAGNDLGVVVARFSSDDFLMAVSTDGVTFTSDVPIGLGTAVATGVPRTFFYGGIGPFFSELFVHPIDLSSFGLAEGSSVSAVRITGLLELDLIRVPGLATPVPEPGTMVLSLPGLAVLLSRRRKSKAAGA